MDTPYQAGDDVFVLPAHLELPGAGTLPVNAFVLRSEIDDALEAGADERAERLQAELDLLVAELAGAFGLGGRSRQASSTAERARLNVTRALRAATARLGQVVPEAGAVLDRRLRTGLYCAYEPQEGDEVLLVVQRRLNGTGTG